MCGICGIIYADNNRPVAPTLLTRMNQTLQHRGPDDSGLFVKGNVGLGHKRLSIIDLKTGAQPFRNEDETLCIVFNGEIYNFQAIQKRLENKGHVFRTKSDTEVIVHAYEEWDIHCVDYLDGMFAFAIWDDRKKRLFAARDRFGKKPFYYTLQNKSFVFASELKAIRQFPGFKEDVDLVALHHYLTLQYVPAPLSIYKGVFKLRPGHMLLYDYNGLKTNRYWDLSYIPKLNIGMEDAIEELRRLLRKAVQKRLISDVALGAFLSGGIDSSIIVGLMSQLSNEPVKTFSIGFEEEAFNELPYAKAVAKRWGTDHHEFIVSYKNVLSILPKAIQSFDEPFADSCAIQTYYLAQLTKGYVTVALNGDGGDEVFAGYPRYWLDSYVRPYVALPRFITQSIVPAAVQWIKEPANVAIEANWIMGLKRLSQVADTSPKASIIRWGSYFSDDFKRDLYLPEISDGTNNYRTEDVLAEDFDRASAESFLDRTLYVDTLNYLPGNNLTKMDRMTMAHSLEARSPLLDHHFVEFVARLPEKMKLKGRHTKFLLREAFKDLLPTKINSRAKRGFAAPVELWLKSDLREYVHDILQAPNATIRSYFSLEKVKKLIHEHEYGKVNHGRRIWALMVLEEWGMSRK